MESSRLILSRIRAAYRRHSHLLAGLAARAGSAQDLTAPLPLDPAIRTGTLPNGLTFFIRHNAQPEQPRDAAAGREGRLDRRGRRSARAGAPARAHGVQRHDALQAGRAGDVSRIDRRAVRPARQRLHELRRDGLHARRADRQRRRARARLRGAERLRRRHHARRRPRSTASAASSSRSGAAVWAPARGCRSRSSRRSSARRGTSTACRSGRRRSSRAFPPQRLRDFYPRPLPARSHGRDRRRRHRAGRGRGADPQELLGHAGTASGHASGLRDSAAQDTRYVVGLGPGGPGLVGDGDAQAPAHRAADDGATTAGRWPRAWCFRCSTRASARSRDSPMRRSSARPPATTRSAGRSRRSRVSARVNDGGDRQGAQRDRAGDDAASGSTDSARPSSIAPSGARSPDYERAYNERDKSQSSPARVRAGPSLSQRRGGARHRDRSRPRAEVPADDHRRGDGRARARDGPREQPRRDRRRRRRRRGWPRSPSRCCARRCARARPRR